VLECPLCAKSKLHRSNFVVIRSRVGRPSSGSGMARPVRFSDGSGRISIDEIYKFDAAQQALAISVLFVSF
jgi:hypothetical protein